MKHIRPLITSIRWVTLTLCTLSIGVYVSLLAAAPDRRLQWVLDWGVWHALDYRLLLATWVHVRLGHLLVNLAGIAVVGNWLEARLGRTEYVLLVAWCTLASWTLYLARTPQKPAVGASGLMFGLLGAFLGLQGRGALMAALASGVAWWGVTLASPAPGTADIHATGFLAGCLAAAVIDYSQRGKVTARLLARRIVKNHS